MKELLVVTNDTYAAKTGGGTITADTFADLATGAIAIFDESGTIIDPANPSLALTGDKVYMAVGTGAGAPWLTSLIDRASLEYAVTDYQAPVAKIMWVGQDSAGNGSLNLPNPLVVGSTATVVVWNKSVRREEWNKSSLAYNYVVKAGDNAKSIVDGLVAAINGNTKSIVTAANVADLGISFTGKVAGVDFTLTVQNILANSTLTHSNTAKHLFGHGTYAQLKEYEVQATARRGNVNSFTYTNELWSMPSNLVIGGTYDVAVCNWKNATNDSLQTLQPTYKKELLIAVDSTKTAVRAAIVAILTAL